MGNSERSQAPVIYDRRARALVCLTIVGVGAARVLKRNIIRFEAIDVGGRVAWWVFWGFGLVLLYEGYCCPH
jgi:hypothetical protein